MADTDPTANPNARGDDPAEFITRTVIEAPRELVYACWVEAGLVHWWGPAGMRVRIVSLDVRPGGVFHYGMAGPDGAEMFGKFSYREVVPGQHIEAILCFADAAGNPVRHPLSPHWPLECLNTTNFSDAAGKTALTVRSLPYVASELERKTFTDGHAGMTVGFNAMLSQLSAYLNQSCKE